MNNKLEVIGIDHGWSMMKTISQVFVTGVKEITTTPALFGDVLEYEGKFYKVGTVRQEVKDTKVEDDSFYLLTLAAVAKELKRRGLAEAKVFLAVGLPLTRFGAEKNDFIKYLTKNKRVTEDEQIGIFERYCKFLNSLDCNYKITINNKNKNMDDLRDKVLIAEKNDGFNNYRRIYNDIIEEKIIEGRQGIEQERYLTITIERKNFEEAKAQFATLEATIHKAFIELGADIVPLNGNERLKVLYDYYHLGDEGSFDFDIKKAKKVGPDFRNDLCNGMVKYFPDHFEDESKFCKALFIKKYPSSLSDRCVLWSGAFIRRRLWMNKRYRLAEIEEAVSEMEELIDIEDDIAEINDDFQIVVSGWSVYVESLNLTLRQNVESSIFRQRSSGQ